MGLKTLNCPNCGAGFNPTKYRCEYCGSYVFMSDENYVDFSNVKIEMPPIQNTPSLDTKKYPGIYVYGRLLGKGEKPISLGVANYYTGLVTAGGKLLLTNRSLLFSAHAFNVGRQETSIDLNEIKEIKVTSNMLVSQNIEVKTETKSHRFVVYHGKEWVKNIQDAIAVCPKPTPVPPTPKKSAESNNYIVELQQLKQLLDAGILTQEEFDIKKRMLLRI